MDREQWLWNDSRGYHETVAARWSGSLESLAEQLGCDRLTAALVGGYAAPTCALACEGFVLVICEAFGLDKARVAAVAQQLSRAS